MGNGQVYFITYDNAAWRSILPVIKIGATTDLPNRLSALSTGSPIKLLVVASIAAKDPYHLEKKLHKNFQRERLNGEWFKLNPKMVEIIRTYPLVDDRFNDLFDFDSHIRETIEQVRKENADLKHELNVQALEIKNLKKRLDNELNENAQEEAFEANRNKIGMSRFIKMVKRGPTNHR